MIVVAQCRRHCVVDDKGAGAIDHLCSSSRIAQTSIARLRVNVGQRCLRGLEAKLGRFVGISHDGQQEVEWRNFWVRGSGGECCISEGCFLVCRTALTSAAPFAWFRSSWHHYFSECFGSVKPVIRSPLLGRRGPKPDILHCQMTKYRDRC
jgi:hypothetical protein